MIEIKEAVKIAMDLVHDLYDPDSVNNPLLEEVILSQDEKNWAVTIGFDYGERQVPPPSSFPSESTPSRRNRIYKLILINIENGKPVAMNSIKT
jgi:hypothetical protein